MERDQFAEEAEFASCRLAREFEHFEESSPLSPSQSPPPTPMTSIRVVSLPPTQSSADQCMAGEDADAVFHTPPEHHADQNLNDLCAEKVTISEAERGRVVAGEEFDGDTVPLGDTEVVETEGDGGVGRTRLLSDGFEKGVEIVKSAEKTADDGHGNGGVSSNGKRIENIDGRKRKLFPSCKGKEEEKDAGDTCEIVGYKSCETESGGLEKGGEMAKSAEKIAKDGHGNGRVSSNVKRTEKVDAGKRKLSPLCKGKEKETGERSEKQSGSPPLLKEKGKDMGESSKKQNGYKHDDDEDDDYIATVKRRGMNFVESRFWKHRRL